MGKTYRKSNSMKDYLKGKSNEINVKNKDIKNLKKKKKQDRILKNKRTLQID